MRRSRSAVALAATVAVLVSLVAAPVQAARPQLQHLNPGGVPSLAERVPVNVVFVGYEPAQVPAAAFRAGLPRRYEPVVRSRLSYDVKEKLGLTYTYGIRYADRAYEDRFIGELKRLARPAPLTGYQTAYNNQKKNVLNVTANNHIDPGRHDPPAARVHRHAAHIRRCGRRPGPAPRTSAGAVRTGAEAGRSRNSRPMRVRRAARTTDSAVRSST